VTRPALDGRVHSSATNDTSSQKERASPESGLAAESGGRGIPAARGDDDTIPVSSGPRGPVQRAAVYHPRDSAEWQGMRIDLRFQPACENSDSCGLAKACVNGRCGPCRVDRDCAKGESCVWDHCLRDGNIECRSTRDCSGNGAKCIYTGYSPDARGNGEMKALCVSLGKPPPLPPREVDEPRESDPSSANVPEAERLLEQLRREAVSNQ